MSDFLDSLLANTRFVEETGCREWLGKIREKRGYPIIMIDGKRVRVTRLVCHIVSGMTDEQDALHTCDNPPCIEPSHLFPGSYLDNVADRQRKGRQARGEKVPQSKLTEDDVRAIRAAPNAHVDDLADRFGITRNHVYKIWRGEGWTHLPGARPSHARGPKLGSKRRRRAAPLGEI